VNALRLLVDGRLLVAGEFTSFEGDPRLRIARLLANGLLDTGFSASTNGPVDALLMLPDGRCFAAGRFTQAGGLPRAYLARFATDGMADAAFSPMVNGAVK
jgi:hypothetical protein